MYSQQLTTNTGSPVGDNQNSKTAGNNGPVLLEDIHLMRSWQLLTEKEFLKE
jgi:catalase